MKPDIDTDRKTDVLSEAEKRRFTIEKLEERIAPWGCAGKINPQGKCVGGGPPRPWSDA